MNGALPPIPAGNAAQPNVNLSSQTAEMATTPPAGAPAAPATSTSKTSEAATSTPHVGEAPLAQNLSDNEERQKMLADEAKKRKLGVLPLLVGGAGDAISTAATAFGAQAGTPVLDQIVKMESENIKQDKAQFETNLKNDPTSDVSRSYQKVVSMMMGKPATDPDIQKMSANTIAAQLPEVEKFMAKELGLKQIQANKELSMSMSRGNERDRMWSQAVQTINQIRDNYMQTRGVGAAATRMKELYPDDADRLSKMARGMSFQDATGISYKNPAQTNQSAVPTITSEQDYNRLPSGASYQDASGKVYR